jgi:transposase-like protein
MRAQQRKRSERLQLVRKFLEEGADADVFCEMVGIKRTTLEKWLLEYRHQDEPGTSPARFVQVALSNHVGAGSVELVIGNCRLTFSTLPPPEYLKALVVGHV